MVNADHTTRADVYCEEDKITAVGLDLEVPAGTEEIDAGGCLVMPGGSTRTPTWSCPSWARG